MRSSTKKNHKKEPNKKSQAEKTMKSKKEKNTTETFNSKHTPAELRICELEDR